jgi:hypothetical protein
LRDRGPDRSIVLDRIVISKVLSRHVRHTRNTRILPIPTDASLTMPRNSQFHHEIHDTLPDSTKSDLSRVRSATGTFPFLRPTHAHFHVGGQKLDWNSRDHRKGRHPVRNGERRRISTFLRLEWWNISWWVAVVCSVRHR